MRLRKLTREEQRIMINKGTEMPYTGKYDNFYKEGLYMCRRCGAALFRSDSKFDAHCGWPAFDDQIPGAVEKGENHGLVFGTEVHCARCKAHLGHVYHNEFFTRKNIRYCVNSISMAFVPKGKLHGNGRSLFYRGR